MISREKAAEAFEAYLKHYDMTDGMIRLKKEHSYRTADNAAEIAESLQLDEEQQNFAWVLGLVHDIGRFAQAQQYHSFLDYKTIDHGDLGAEILKENDYALQYVPQEYAEILIPAVKNHNKYRIEDGLDDQQMLFSKIIRDADKTDILYLRADHSYDAILHIDREQIETGIVSDEIYDCIMHHQIIQSSHRRSALDRLVSMPALIFDLNYSWAVQTILHRNSTDRILDAYDYKNQKGKRQVQQIRECCRNWLKEKAGND